MKTIRLWDLPTRLFHWLLVIAVVGAVVTVKLGAGWMAWHERFGLALLACWRSGWSGGWWAPLTRASVSLYRGQGR